MADQVLVFDKEFAKRNPGLGFYLRIEHSPGNVEIVDLPDCKTMPAARAKAENGGYNPTHHLTYVEGSSNIPMRY